MQPLIFDIQRSSFVDGPGIRTTVFFKGCNLRCAWCHNPESQSQAPQLMFYKNRCTGCGFCAKICPNGQENCTLCGKCALYCAAEARRLCGKPHDEEAVMEDILADKAFYASSGGGVTFSGGECLLYPDALCSLLARCRAEGVHTAVDTAGHVPREVIERVLPLTDLFLYDVKLMDAALHRHFVGADNARILSNLAYLLSVGARIHVRVPVIGGVNDTEENMLAMRAFFEENGYPERIELLPYHAMGEAKREALGGEVQRFETPTRERLEALAALLPRTAVR